MKKSFFFVLAAFSFAPCLTAHAEEKTAPAAATVAPVTDSRFTVGIETFTDNYQEPDPSIQVNNKAAYGSITMTFAPPKGLNDWTWSQYEGRLSYGHNNYKSVDGYADGIPQYEAEFRGLIGSYITMDNAPLRPYIGLGARFFLDNGNGRTTNKGYYGYDRDIAQVYMPIGAVIDFDGGNGWVISPKVEYDALLYGRVDSRMQNGGGYDVVNTQNALSGYGLRGELMFGKNRWRVGPFIRYWNILNSTATSAPDGSIWIEPHNVRTQTGIALRVSFK